ncbi:MULTISPECIES: hypothetical protein [unclassified Pseudomonas]|uniref:hypothetical protein n=1 Tax=unclassified Pseudomonas TaxID=196821 RepID=UPI0015A690ED|nr:MULTISPECIES: hypothetical protein [unclassified Pseudomonas]
METHLGDCEKMTAKGEYEGCRVPLSKRRPPASPQKRRLSLDRLQCLRPLNYGKRPFSKPSLDPKGAADYGYFVNAMCHGGKFANLPQVLLSYRLHGQQQSGDQALKAISSGIRTKVLNEFFPDLNQLEIGRVEPLLRWLAPPALPAAEVQAGLDLLPRLLATETSKHGESREQRDGFLQACQRRSSEGLAQLKARA